PTSAGAGMAAYRFFRERGSPSMAGLGPRKVRRRSYPVGGFLIGAVTVSMIVCLAVGFVGGATVHAQALNYPSGPVRILTGAPPGGAMDILARGFAAHLQELWGVPVIVENRVGAAQRVAYSEFVRSKPDGHTLLITIVNIIAAHE